MGVKIKIALLAVGAIYRRAGDSRTMWIKLDGRQHAPALYDSISEKWQMGWAPGIEGDLEDFDPDEEVVQR